MNARAATPEPFTLDLAKAHCRIDTSDEDDLIEKVYIPAARQTAEEYTGITIRPVEVETEAEPLVDGSGLLLSGFPAFDLTTLTAIDRDGVETALDIDEYGARIVNGSMYATIQTARALPSFTTIRASYTAGYPDGELPPNLLLAMLLLTGDAYENRESQQAGVVLQRNPRAIALLDPFRITFGL